MPGADLHVSETSITLINKDNDRDLLVPILIGGGPPIGGGCCS